MLRGNRGDAAGVEPGASSSKRSSSEHGNRFVPVRPAQPVRRSGWVHRRPIGTERGGAAVVVRGRESRSHGQGRQRDQQGRDGNVQRYRGEYLGRGPTGRGRVTGMEDATKLHQWAAADLGRRFDDLHNLVFDPATLQVAFARVAGNRGARTPGVDGRTVHALGLGPGGVETFLDEIRDQLKAREFFPLPVRKRMVPKSAGKLRRLGIPTVADRVVQAALKLVLEPIFEADFEPVSYGVPAIPQSTRRHRRYPPLRHQGLPVGLGSDIEACFDRIDHSA